MKIPGGDRAYVDPTKLREYALNPLHPKGRNKARVFRYCLGLTEDDADYLSQILLAAARESNRALKQLVDENGERYVIDLEVQGPAGRSIVRSAWIIRTGEDFPRLSTCYVL